MPEQQCSRDTFPYFFGSIWMSTYKFIPTLSATMAREFVCLSGGPETFEESLTCIMPHAAFPAATSNDAKMLLGHLVEIQSL